VGLRLEDLFGKVLSNASLNSGIQDGLVSLVYITNISIIKIIPLTFICL
jgi:hypothetical protein